MLKIFFLSAVLLFSSAAWSIDYATGVITRIKSFSEPPGSYDINNLGLLLVYVDELSPACSSAERRVAIGSDHPLYSTVLALSMLGKTTQVKVKIGHQGRCTLRSNAWDFAVIEVLE